MSSTMQAWRTGLRLSKEEMYRTLNAFFQSNVFDDYWEDVDTDTAGQVDYYISDSVWWRIKYENGNITNQLQYGNPSIPGSAQVVNGISFNAYSNVSIYKVNSCMAICAATGTSAPTVTTYSKTANIIIDSTNSGEGKCVIQSPGDSGYSTIIDSPSSGSSSPALLTIYTPYYATYSLKNSTNLAQIVPLKNNLYGKSFDNLHGVLLTPVMNDFVSLQNEKWLFTRGMALSAGSEVPTPVDIETVQSSS